MRKHRDHTLTVVIRRGFKDTGKWLSLIVASIDRVAGAIANISTLPQPQPNLERGTLVSRYRIPDDQPPIVFVLVGANFTDAKGAPVDAKNIDLSLETTNAAALTGVLGPQTLSDDGLSVSAEVTLTSQSPSVDLAVAAYKATNRVTGNVVAADSDEFIVGPGEANIGTLDSPVPLTPEPEA